MASVRATAKELLEQTRRLAGNCEPPRLARYAVISFVRHLQTQRDLPLTPFAIDPPKVRSLTIAKALSSECPAAGLSGEFAELGLLDAPDAIGRLWQAMNEPALKTAFATAGKGDRKFTPDQIPAVTQLFTPSAVVDWLLDGTLGRVWKERHPDTKIVVSDEKSPVGRRLQFLQVRELRLLDPACGTMNFGLAAIDYFRRLYREELHRAGEPGWPARASVESEEQIDDAILRHNLYGIELDPFVLRLARHTLELKLGRTLNEASLHLLQGDALLDARLGENLTESFDVVVTNPPYLSVRNVSPGLAKSWKQHYPLACRDAYACFIDRSLQLLKPGGRAGLLTMQSFMFTGSYEPLRRSIADRAAIEKIAQFGGGLFTVGNPGTLQTAAFVLRAEPEANSRAVQDVTALRLVDNADKGLALSRMGYQPMPGDASRHGLVAHATNEFHLTQHQLLQSPRGAWIYWLSRRQRTVLSSFPKLAEIAPPRQGLATTDNARFVRAWWEIAPFSVDPACEATAGRWRAFVKSGQSRRWHESPRHRVNWENDGAEIKANIVRKYPYLKGNWEWVAKNARYYGRAGVTYSYLTSGQFSARELSAGSIFDVAGSSLFPGDPLLVLAVLNSSVSRRFLEAINPTVNFQVGDLAELPMLTDASAGLRGNVSQLIDLYRQIDQADERAPDFVAPLNFQHAADMWRSIGERIIRLELDVEAEVADGYALPPDTERAVWPAVDREELARQWVSFALGRAMANREWAAIDALFASAVREALASLAGESAAAELDRAVGGIDSFLIGDFPAWHSRQFKSRPRWWVFGQKGEQVVIAHDRANRRTMAEALRHIGQSVSADWERVVDDGIAVNLSPLIGLMDDRPLQRALAKTNESGRQGGLDWSRTYQGQKRKSQVRMELRIRSRSDESSSREALLASSEQVNSAPTR